MRNDTTGGLSALIFLAVVVIGGGCGKTPISDSEARGQLKEISERLIDKQKRITELESQVAELSQENKRLATQHAAATGGKGIELEDRQRSLDARKADLDRREQDLITREEGAQQRERKVATQEKEFYEKTNMTMTDIGEARHVKSEYENMRAEKDAAVEKSEWWLKFVWGVSITLGLALLGIVVLLYRSISQHAAQRRELEYRREVAQLLGAAIANQLPADQAATIVQAFDRLAGIDSQRSPPRLSSSPTSG